MAMIRYQIKINKIRCATDTVFVKIGVFYYYLQSKLHRLLPCHFEPLAKSVAEHCWQAGGVAQNDIVLERKFVDVRRHLHTTIALIYERSRQTVSNTNTNTLFLSAGLTRDAFHVENRVFGAVDHNEHDQHALRRRLSHPTSHGCAFGKRATIGHDE
jgi:hypothetical protein